MGFKQLNEKAIRRLKFIWAKFWMTYAGINRFGRYAARLAAMFAPPYYGKIFLSTIYTRGFISHKAIVNHSALFFGKNDYIDDDVLIYQDLQGGKVELGDGVHIHRGSIIQTGQGGCLKIGACTHIQPRCQFSAYKGSIVIGKYVEIAPNCAFYPYDHKLSVGEFIQNQALSSKGNIEIKDDVWIGTGVVVLSGVSIGKGAVVGAGSVVTKSIPDHAIAAGVPAKVIKMRQQD
jgi:acetyltransferase-like isoleucine patch superfamily enzyme